MKSSPALSLLASAVLLAACGPDRGEVVPGPDASRPGPGAVTPLRQEPSAPVPTDPARAALTADDGYWTRLPDFADPRVFLREEIFPWGEWEVPVVGDRRARLEALGIRPMEAGESGGQAVEDFHFVDFSGDGVADVVYQGAGFIVEDGEVYPTEGVQLTMWQVLGGRAVEVFDHFTTLERMWREGPGRPARFRTIQHGCCAETHAFVEYFRPEARGDTVSYRVEHRIVGSVTNREPSPGAIFAAPKRFTVANDRYLLRYTPEVSDADLDWEGHGNASAEYGRGARGVALAEATDATGRTWWYVMMDARTPPTAAYLDDWAGEMPADRLGWMSSRFLEVEANPDGR